MKANLLVPVFAAFIAILMLGGCSETPESSSPPTTATKDEMSHGSDTPSTQMHMSMVKMNDDMAKMKMSNDVDRDFAQMMIIHHQGAIDMAELELLHGKSPQLKEMARDVVQAQKKEIEELQAYLDNPSN